MATSTKVRFNLETLRERALESLDLRIAQAELEVASYENDAALAQRVSDWRERQIHKLRRIVSELDGNEADVDNHRLSKFAVDDIPTVSYWDRNDARNRLKALIHKRSQVSAKVEALLPDPDGGIALTKTQLQDIFGL